MEKEEEAKPPKRQVPLSSVDRKIANRIARRAIRKTADRLKSQSGPLEELGDGDGVAKPAKIREAQKTRAKRYAALQRKRKK